MANEDKEKITIYPKFTITDISYALGPCLFNWTHTRNIAYSLQFLSYCEELIEDRINIKYSVDSMFSKAMTVVASSIIECLLFDSLQQKGICREKWVDTNPPTELPLYKNDPKKRARILYQDKQEIPLDRFVFFSETIDLAIKNKIIKNGLKTSLNRVKNARDLIHIRGSEELDLNKINLEFYYKTTRPTLIKIMKELGLEKALEFFER